MARFAEVFPLLVFLATLLLAFFAIRLSRRLSRGSQSAGPREVVRPQQVGLQQTPWELSAIDEQLRSGWNARGRIDLVTTVNRLTTAAGLHDPALQLPTNASDEHISRVVAHLEHHLELTPPVPGRGPNG